MVEELAHNVWAKEKSAKSISRFLPIVVFPDGHGLTVIRKDLDLILMCKFTYDLIPTDRSVEIHGIDRFPFWR